MASGLPGQSPPPLASPIHHLQSRPRHPPTPVPAPAHPPTHCSLAQVLKVDAEAGAIVIKGAVPGKPGNLVEIAPSKVVGVNI